MGRTVAINGWAAQEDDGGDGGDGGDVAATVPVFHISHTEIWRLANVCGMPGLRPRLSFSMTTGGGPVKFLTNRLTCLSRSRCLFVSSSAGLFPAFASHLCAVLAQLSPFT